MYDIYSNSKKNSDQNKISDISVGNTIFSKFEIFIQNKVWILPNRQIGGTNATSNFS